ncbi:hypothetical protein F441_06826 [Phytophthora nicotianae CJ01A1]|uniref:Uncharacterized protein n=6 Tax=Phytophthora nicotianae TaxID=4792 RepID=W2RFL3_PHYN3|nr:hypothetical protein PPTG_02907 [Phytophthora nicotianae INRA-310]ETI49277.1 hypothetical protein F443_06822 [Phytophthora nicotianae P1569]ETK89168.1 hypothetical protein L915_06692 [Phytophthora nicotianae]ETO78005.1 hypothetical protein F444_06891 [Phytophthora nicotianae P1976]ETP19077.1 hypothetical protein F441_06826 [Phytophthora nicotianae CJ01A1]ETP47022.1 hypothetical protein F442_06858 [Phytophthora nicotianae P10297]
MGCCSSKAQLSTVSETTRPQPRPQQQPRGGQTLGGSLQINGVEPSAAEKRARAAEAAEARMGDWRQGGHADPDKARSIAQRREKDDLLAKIYNRYTTLGREPPIGLPSCDLDQLRRHLETLR